MKLHPNEMFNEIRNRFHDKYKLGSAENPIPIGLLDDCQHAYERVKAERDELHDLLDDLMNYMPSSWEHDRRAWPVGLTDKCRAALAKMEAKK